jgi:glycosyltransferase involved in cell wall biosynthesis
MHIGLNAHLLSLTETYRGAGINWYICNLLTHLPRVDHDNHYTAFLGDGRFTTSGLALKLSRLPTSRPTVRIFWEQVVQPFALQKERVDLLHALAFVTPLFSPCPSVVTIYDLSFLLYPESFKRAKRFYLGLFTRLSARRARRIIAISESTKRDVVRRLGVSPEKVQVVYCGIDETLRPLAKDQVADFRSKRGLPERFVLFVGTIEPRKNVTRLIEAFADLRSFDAAQDRFAICDLRLVIGGAKGWFYEDVFARVKELGLEGEVMFPGYIPVSELPLWYNAAELLVYPSLYEGFGLPPLEAMACGTPVVAANTSSLPEVVGEAGLTVDPLDVEGLAEAMRRALSDAALRQEMRERGLQRARGFSWTKTALETVQVYRRAMEVSRKNSG